MRAYLFQLSPGRLAAGLATWLPVIHAAAYTTVPSPNLDLSGLGRVAIAGSFDSISLYTYEGQTQDSFSTNGSQSLLTRLSNGAFSSLAMADADIETMCPFVLQDGSLAGVVVGGNFTSLGGVQAQGIALVNPNTSAITPLPGLSGRVSSVYCDHDSSTVYVGGSFTGGNSSNAIAWTTGWTNLPFAGFNGPVTSITKAPNGNIVFGGNFEGLGNTTTTLEDKDGQVINLGSGNITSGSTTSTAGFDDPSNIICKTGSQDGAGNTWLLANDTAGYWQADFGFGFNPTKLRLYNTNEDDRGTKTFYITAYPINGIMNLTYIDTNGQNASCTVDCPLPQGNTSYQDFRFVNVIGMNGFRIDITAWYGAGAGLAGIEMFQDDIFSFAIAAFNEPKCDGVSTLGASSTSTGSWQVTPSGTSTSEYLTASLSGSNLTVDAASVVFEPDIKQSGNYSVTVYTPGCINDGTCSTRGTVNITGTMTTENGAITTTLYQTNDYDKYDQIYYGYVDVAGDAFRPTITLSPSSGQTGPITVVAQRVRFVLESSTGGLNGLYEYNANQATVSTDYSSSAIDSAGTSLDSGAVVNSFAVYQQTMFVAGNFSSSNISNIFSITSNTTSALSGGGLNAVVLTTYLNDSMLYVGGNFTNTEDGAGQGLNGVAAYSISDNVWQPLGAGVSGSVIAIVPLQLNISGSDEEDVLAITGTFDQIYGSGENATVSASGFAIWVPARSNWLHNIPTADISVSGQLMTQTTVPGFTDLWAGSVDIESLGLSNAVALTGSGEPTLESLDLNFTATQSSVQAGSLRKRANAGQTVSGVSTGLFYGENGMNITVLGGHFTASATNGSSINNLMIINDTSSQIITGITDSIDSDSTFLAMDVSGTLLFAGGNVTGNDGSNSINGVIVYGLDTGTLDASQPPPLSGDNVQVNAIAAQPNSENVFVGGSFTNAGSLSCATLCMYSTASSQWNSPGSGLTGSISAMAWASDTQLVIAGNLTAGGNDTTMATYDSTTQKFTEFAGANSLPGPVTALTPADTAYNQFWVSGTATSNNTAFLEKYDGTNWISVSGLGVGSYIRGLQILSLTKNHAATSLVDADQVLMLTGTINVPNFGNASAVLFNGTDFQPLMLTSMDSTGQGSISRMFVENPANFLSSSSHYLARGFIVLIGLAIALALIFLVVVAGIVMERYRRRREGYVPMQQLRPDQQSNLSRIPPERLFGSMTEKDMAPMI